MRVVQKNMNRIGKNKNHAPRLQNKFLKNSALALEPHEYWGEDKVRRMEVHAQWLNNLSNCTEVKVFAEGSFEKVGKF